MYIYIYAASRAVQFYMILLPKSQMEASVKQGSGFFETSSRRGLGLPQWHTVAIIKGGVPWGYPDSWMVSFRENPLIAG